MSVDILVLMVFLAVFVQPNKERRAVAFIFGAVVSLHTIFMSSLDGFAYYVSGALSASAIIMLTSYFDKVPRLAISLHKVCFAAIVLNMVGWVMWLKYFPPLLYNLAFSALYLWALFALMTGSGGYVIRGDRNNGWYANFLVNHSPRISNDFKGSK